MPLRRKAVIDVGTNSVKLFVADVRGGSIQPLREESTQTRLGRGFYEDHLLQPDAIAQTAQAVGTYAAQARDLGAESLRIIATSAARDAINAADLLKALGYATGVPVEVISGEQEAAWVCQGVLSDPRLHNGRIVIMDLGGGSTEFILAGGDLPQRSRSFPLGTVRLLEQHPHSDPPLPVELARCRSFVSDFLQREVVPFLEQGWKGRDHNRPQILIGTGGTATILARMDGGLTGYDREQIEAQTLDPARVTWHVESLWGQTLAQRQSVSGLPPNRADVILTGVVIYEAVMRELLLNRLNVSTRGLRWAALMD